jgi:hypothetical protein
MPIPSTAPSDVSLCSARWVKTTTSNMNPAWKLQQWSVTNSQWVDVIAYQIDGTVVSPPVQVS